MRNDEKGRKNAEILRKAMQRHTLETVSAFAGGSISLISRWFGESAEVLGRALAYIGLKVVPVEMLCVNPDTYQAYRTLAEQHVLDERARHQRERVFEATLFEDPE